MQLHPYLSFDGKCREAFHFYAAALGGEIGMMMTYGESPMAAQIPPGSGDRIMHGHLNLQGAVLMGADLMPGQDAAHAGFSLSLMPKTPEEAERMFAALAEHGTIRMPLQTTFWSPRFGTLTDRFGIPWMVNCTPDA